MRKWMAASLVCLLLLSGCGRKGKPLFDPVFFYYPKTEYEYGSDDSVISWEAMDGTGHTEEWEYLLAEYFAGPIDEGLCNPFPENTMLLSAGVREDTFFLELSEEALTIPTHQFTLGCSCLSMTCFELTQVRAVIVTCGIRQIIIPREGMLLLDNHWPEPK